MNKIIRYLNLFLITSNVFLFSGKFTNEVRDDGFGSQYLHLLLTYSFADQQNLQFRYSPMQSVEHNIETDPDFIDKLERFIGF
jgi:hypothetical protein